MGVEVEDVRCSRTGVLRRLGHAMKPYRSRPRTPRDSEEVQPSSGAAFWAYFFHCMADK